MKVFITGGSGYIGRPTVAALITQGHEVTALARSDASVEFMTALGADVVHGGLDDLDVLRSAASRADGVIHLAAHDGPDARDVDAAAAEAMQAGAGPKPYVHTGGVWVYGDTAGVVDEDAPVTPPPITSWRPAAEAKVMAHAQHGGRPILVMPAMVYGHGRGLLEECFVQPARATGEVRYIGAGTNHWALVHVDDLADLYVLALEGATGARYAAVGDSRPTVLEAVQSLSQAAECPGQTESITLEEARNVMGPIADAFALDQQFTNARARKQLGWAPPQRDVLTELATPLIVT